MDTAVGSVQADGSRAPVRRRVALVFTDIVGSTRLLTELGDLAGNRRIHEHHRLATRLLRRLGGGEIVNTAGDSIFLAFDDARQALWYALRLQRELKSWLVDEPAHLRVRDRVGIHVGEVEEAARPDGARDLTGFAVSVAFSVMGLAGPDQVLLSEEAFDLARSAPDRGRLSEFPGLRWLSHGRYPLKGLEGPVPVFEVGEVGLSLLQPPPRSTEDRRSEEDLTGWRPAIGIPVPGTGWVIERFLGSSGFGEVWLARDAAHRRDCALRFCFRPSRVRALREARPLFERLAGSGGQHPGIARLQAFEFDHAPHYLENEYVPGASLTEWCHASVGRAPPDEAFRLEIIALTAEALDAAHRQGIVHGDLKPAALVIRQGDEDLGQPRVKVIDFGTGLLQANELAADLAQGERVRDARPEAELSGGGAPLYWAPELFKGSPPSPASDIYALGVLLYQVLVCDLAQPVTVDVARRVRDPLLLDDLLACLATDPSARLGSAGELATRLRRLPERRRELARRERRSYWQGVLRTSAIAAVVVGLMGWLAWRAMEKQEEASHAAERASAAQRTAETNAIRLRVANGVRLMAEGDLSGSIEQFVEALRQDSGGPSSADIHRRRIASVLRSAPRLVREWHLGALVIGTALDPSGSRIAAGGMDGRIQAWRVDDGKPDGVERRLPGGLQRLGYTPDGRDLFALSDGNALMVWPAASSETAVEPVEVASGANDVACSPDGRWYAVAQAEGPVRLIPRMESVGDAVDLEGPAGVYQVAFGQGGRLLAGIAGSGDEAVLCLWDVGERRLLRRARSPGSPVRILQFDASDTYVLVSTERDVFLLLARDLSEAAPPRRHEDVVMWAGFGRRGTLMMSTSAGPGSRVQVSDTAGAGGLPVDLPHPHSVTGGDLSPDGRYVLTGCFDRHLRLWDPGRVQLVGEPVRHPAWRDHRNFQVHFLPDGRRAVTVVDDAVRVFDFASHSSTVPPLELEEPLAVLALSPDGLRAAGATRHGLMAVWEVAGGTRLTSRLRHPGRLRHVVFSADNARVVSVEDPGNAALDAPSRVWISEPIPGDGAPVLLGTVRQPVFVGVTSRGVLHVVGGDGGWWTWDLGRPGSAAGYRALGLAVRGGELSPDGGTLATLSNPGGGKSEVRLWSAESGAPQGPVLVPGYNVRRMAFSGDGSRLATACTDGLLEPRPAVRWDLKTGRRLDPLLWHEDGVLAVAYHPHDGRIVTGGEDSLVRLWDPRGSQPLLAEQRMGYQVLHVNFSEDGRLFASASVDGTARVWESDTGEPVTPVLHHPSMVWRTWFTRGANRLLTLCNDGRGYLWDLAPIEGDTESLAGLARLLKGDATPGAAGDARHAEADRMRWREVQQVSPAAVAAWHRREAELCEKEGRDDLALDHLRHAVRALPGHWPLRWQLGLLLEKSGRRGDADAEFREVLRLDPDCLAAGEKVAGPPGSSAWVRPARDGR